MCNTYERLVFDEGIELANNAMLKVRPEMFDRWDFDKNDELGLNIYKVTKASNKKAWWIGRCGHEWDRTIIGEMRARGCPYCLNKRILKGFNDMWTTNPDLASLLADPEDGYKYMQSSNEKVNWKCSKCDFRIKGKIINNVVKQGLHCPKCSDGLSYPEKLFLGILLNLDIKFIYQKSFLWSDKRIYDFYLPDFDTIIEIHGMQHYKETTRKGSRTLQEEQDNDRLKEQLAKDNGIEHYIVIDARYSDFEYIHKNVINSAIYFLLDLSNVDWKYVNVFSLNSLVKDVSLMFNGGMEIVDIIQKTGLSRSTVTNYLKQGDNIGWCKYNARQRMIDRGNRLSETRKVVQLTFYGTFIRSWDSITQAVAGIEVGNVTNISACCREKQKTAFGFKWMYKEDYDKYIEKQLA